MTRKSKVWLAMAGVAMACGFAVVACGNAGQPQGAGTGSAPARKTGSGSGGNGESAGDDGAMASSSGASSNGGGSGGSSGDTGHPGGGSDAGATQGASDSGTTPPTPHMGNTCLKAGSGDYSKAGPSTVMTKSVDLGAIEGLPDAGPTTYTNYYPQPFETS